MISHFSHPVSTVRQSQAGSRRRGCHAPPHPSPRPGHYGGWTHLQTMCEGQDRWWQSWQPTDTSLWRWRDSNRRATLGALKEREKEGATKIGKDRRQRWRWRTRKERRGPEKEEKKTWWKEKEKVKDGERKEEEKTWQQWEIVEWEWVWVRRWGEREKEKEAENGEEGTS